MRVVAPFVRFHPKATRALDSYASGAERVPVGGSDSAYFELLSGLWRAREAFLLIEHDVEIRAGLVEEAANCPEPWCIWPYQRLLPGPHSSWVDGAYGPGVALLERSLGCTRFSRALLVREPDLMESVPKVPIAWESRGHWRRLDDAIGHLLGLRGYSPHVHHPEVRHHHWLARWERCSCGKEDCGPVEEEAQEAVL